jgi:hypothetical protein
LKNLTAVDGSLLPALPRMVWALWLDDDHKAAKMHLHFEVLRGIPVQATLTTGNDSEKQQLRQTLEAGRLYVVDRGYAEYQLFQDIVDGGSQFIGRIRDNAVWEVVEERPVRAAAAAAGVRSDRVVWLGCAQSKKALRQPVRVLEGVTGKVDSQGRPEVLLLATSCLEMAAELVALAYKFRWEEELFFRWFKCVLGREPGRPAGAGVRGVDRHPAADVMGREEADQADVRDVLPVLHGLGERGGTTETSRTAQRATGQLLIAKIEPTTIGFHSY